MQLARFETFHFHIGLSVAYLKLFVFLSFQFSHKDDVPASIRWEDLSIEQTYLKQNYKLTKDFNTNIYSF